MNTALRERLTQFHHHFQHQLLPLVEADFSASLTPTMSRLLRIWECVEIERFVPSTRGLVGRPPRERVALARAFVAKAVLGLSETSALVERLNADAAEAIGGTPAQFAQFIAAEQARWKKVLLRAKVKPD